MNVPRSIVMHLLADPAVTALLGDRVYTVMPKDKTFPLALVRRVGGVPPFSRPYWVDEATVQIDLWGGTMKAVYEAATTVRQSLATLQGESVEGLVISSVTFGPMSDEQDASETPMRPRVVQEANVRAHPVPA